jgi:transposase
VYISGMSSAILDPAFLAAFRSGTLTEEQAAVFAHLDPLEARFLLLQLSAAIAAPAAGPHTPSGTLPPYAKPTTNGRAKKIGAKPGHPGHARPAPARIDKFQDHQLPQCPCCGGELHRTGRQRTRFIEDLPDDLHSEVTEHTIHRDWCPRCKKQVEPKVPDALPNSQLGNRTLAFSAWLHFGLGTTTSQIIEVFNGHLQMKLTEGGLAGMWHRLADILTPWYEQIRAACLAAPVLHGDETGWRLQGQTWWLWCATTLHATFYWISDNRGHDALDEFFVEEFRGVLVSDFWKAYDAYADRRQKCWAHLLREVKEIDTGPEATDEWRAFSKKLKRIYGDGVRLKLARDELSEEVFDRRVLSLHERLQELSEIESGHPHVRRLAQRLHGASEEMLMFVEVAAVEPTNNRAEREIRPAVQMRKASYGSMSERGAVTRSVLMSVFRTLKLRGLDPLKALGDALRCYTASGNLPPLPESRSKG